MVSMKFFTVTFVIDVNFVKVNTGTKKKEKKKSLMPFPLSVISIYSITFVFIMFKRSQIKVLRELVNGIIYYVVLWED